MTTRREFLTRAAAAASVSESTTIATLASAAQAADAPGSRRTLKCYKVPHTDLTISRLCYGCAMIGYDWSRADAISHMVANVNAAFEEGITLYDTAVAYGDGRSEIALGQAIKNIPGFRHQVAIQTKCGLRPDSSIDNSYLYLTTTIEGSLRRLNTDYLDLVLLHWPDNLVDPDEVAKAFDELHESGKVRYFGVSNHNPYQIELLKKSVRQPLVTNQIQLGLAHWYTMAPNFKGACTHGYEGAATLDYCRAHDIQVQAYSPLRPSNMDKPPNLLAPAADATQEVKKAASLLAEIATKHECSPAAMMMAWLLLHPAQIVPIIGTTKPEHVADNCAADRVQLSRAEWYMLLQAVALIDLSYSQLSMPWSLA